MSKIFLALLIAFEMAADVTAKEFSLNGKIYLALVSIFLFVVANSCWLISLRHKSEMAVGANIFSVTTGVLALLIGVFLYGEVVSVKQYIGMALGAISLILLLA